MSINLPAVSVVIPVKGSWRTIRKTVDSLLAQDYSGDIEIIVVGDYGDSSWRSLRDLIKQRRVTAIEAEVVTRERDSNAKRNIGITQAHGDVIALTDGDMVLPPDWISTAIALINEGWDCVSGSIRSMDDGFWGGYVDKNWMGGKTPHIVNDYTLDSENFGLDGLKPPVTGNTFVNRNVIQDIGTLDSHFVVSYEDYEWSRRIVDGGHRVLRTGQLAARHYHRIGFRGLMREYYRSGRGCGDYIAKHPHCQFGKLRIKQLLMVYLMVVIGVSAALAGILFLSIGAVILASGIAFAVFSGWKAGSLAGTVYPVITFILGLAFSMGLTRRLLRGGDVASSTRVISSQALVPDYN